MEGIKLDIGQMFAVLGDEIRENAAAAGMSVLILIGGNLALDRLGQSASVALSGFLSLGVQLYVTRSALARAGLLQDPSKGRLWSFWGMNIIAAIAILAGCVLFIVPGVFLGARWFVAGPAIIAENLSASEGMRESWKITKRSTWHIVGAILMLFGCGYTAGLGPLFFYSADGAPLFVTAFSYFFVFSTSVCCSLMSVGAYRLLSRSDQALAEVFA
jgi:hypothetical protein